MYNHVDCDVKDSDCDVKDSQLEISGLFRDKRFLFYFNSY